MISRGFRRKENLSIFILFQNNKCKMMYGYVDDESGSSIIKEWLTQRAGVFQMQEISNLYINKVTFSTEKEKTDFMLYHDIYRMEKYYDSDLIVTRYERLLYHEIILRWYDMYKDVVVASQILPSVLNQEKEKVHNAMTGLQIAADEMYDMVTNFYEFTQLISTRYIKGSLLVHPISALSMYQNKKEDMQLFKRQLFRFDDDIYPKNYNSKESEVN